MVADFVKRLDLFQRLVVGVGEDEADPGCHQRHRLTGKVKNCGESTVVTNPSRAIDGDERDAALAPSISRPAPAGYA